jgi:hypothetical protein
MTKNEENHRRNMRGLIFGLLEEIQKRGKGRREERHMQTKRRVVLNSFVARSLVI